MAQTMGLKVCNIPLVLECDPPKELLDPDLDANKVFSLTINPNVLKSIRVSRNRRSNAVRRQRGVEEEEEEGKEEEEEEEEEAGRTFCKLFCKDPFSISNTLGSAFSSRFSSPPPSPAPLSPLLSFIPHVPPSLKLNLFPASAPRPQRRHRHRRGQRRRSRPRQRLRQPRIHAQGPEVVQRPGGEARLDAGGRHGKSGGGDGRVHRLAADGGKERRIQGAEADRLKIDEG